MPGGSSKTTMGLSERQRCALVSLMAAIIAAPSIDAEIRRRAQWLLWGLQGDDPLAAIRMAEQAEKNAA